MAVVGSTLASSLDPPLRDILPGVVITIAVLASIAVTFGGIIKGSLARKRLMKEGVAGTAQLVSVEQTGTRVNDQPMLRLRMLVTVPNKAPYSVLHKEVVPLIRLPEVQPGAQLHVRVDAADPAVMCIAW